MFHFRGLLVKSQGYFLMHNNQIINYQTFQ